MPKAGMRLVDERLGAAVQRLAHEQHIVGLEIGPQRGRDRRHAAREHRARSRRLPTTPSRSSSTSRLGLLKREYTRPAAWPGGGCAAARGVVEEILAVLRVAEDERGRQEDRRLERAFGQGRIESVTHHLGFGLQHAVADLALVIAVGAHRRAPYKFKMPDPISITSPPTNTSLSVLTSSCSIDGRPTNSPCDISKSSGGRRPMAMNQAPRFAQAEPVAGSSRMAPLSGKKNRLEDLLRAGRGEHVGLARAIDALAASRTSPASAARGARRLRWSAE